MDAAIVWALVLVLGVPLVIVGALAVLTATADFVFQGMRIRGGDLKGAIVGALAQVVVGDAEALRLPLLLTLRKKGLLGSATPLLGGAVVEGIEWKLRVEGEHVSTMTESHPVHIGAWARTVDLPVDASVHPPRGLVRTYAQYRRSRRAGAEVRIEVEGVVRVRVFGVRRAVPVAVGQYVVLGDARPELVEVSWTPAGTGRARLELVLRNPYRGQTLTGPIRVEVQQRRRLRKDPVLASWQATPSIPPQGSHQQSLDVSLTRSMDPARGPPDAVRLRARFWWGEERLRRVEEEPLEDGDEADSDDNPSHLSLVPSVIPSAPEADPQLKLELRQRPASGPA